MALQQPNDNHLHLAPSYHLGSGTTATLHNEVNWILSIAGGTWKAGPTESSFEAEDATNTISNGAKTVECRNCSGTKNVRYIGDKPGGTLTFPNVSSSVATNSTIRIRYLNGGKSRMFANVVVNGVANVVAFLPTSGTTARRRGPVRSRCL
jgi:hypothetical protein